MQFYVPTIGDTLYLQEDWTFELHRESRNMEFAFKVGKVDKEKHTIGGPNSNYSYYTKRWMSDSDVITVTLPRKSSLKIDRVYIRGKGERARSFDSITFRMAGCPDKKLTKGRFWVKLKDANKMVCSVTPIFDDEAFYRMKQLDQRFGYLEVD